MNKLDGFEMTGFKRIGISGAGGRDAIEISDTSYAVLIVGGNGDDRIVCGTARAVISGGEGNDGIVSTILITSSLALRST